MFRKPDYVQSSTISNLKGNIKITSIILEVFILLTIILLTYAAVVKAMDLEKFRTQLGQSPMLSPYASVISIFIPTGELLTVVLLAIPKTRIVGLYTALFLMSVFTSYIIIITQYSEYIPCSCGGVIQKLTWNEHLIFNILFTIIIIISIILIQRKTNYNVY